MTTDGSSQPIRSADRYRRSQTKPTYAAQKTVAHVVKVKHEPSGLGVFRGSGARFFILGVHDPSQTVASAADVGRLSTPSACRPQGC